VFLTCVGTGTAAPEPHRVCSGFVLESHGLRMLLDCGAGVVHNMARLYVDWRTLTHLVISHFHNDHIGDVPMLFFAWKYGMMPARSEPLTVIGPRGTKELVRRMAGVFGSHVQEPGFRVEIVELAGGEEHRLNDVANVLACKTPHTAESVAWRFDVAGQSFCYTGDTGMSSDVAKFAQGVDALLIECSLPDELAMDSHLTPARVAEMARIALPRRLLLTHLYPQLIRRDVPELVRIGGWPAKVELVDDGDRLEI
jgi:ribonuclease BN (tRNA processing enzyme)